jgi:multisubunit Na+/H+ antiporter MnhB subunit
VTLSEHEQRLLDSIERALYAEDPKFASTVRATDLRTHIRRRTRRAALLFGLGIVLLLAGVVVQQPALGIVGFVVMLAGALLFATGYRRTGSPSRGRGGRGGPKQKRPGMRERAEERWRKRWEERGQ